MSIFLWLVTAFLQSIWVTFWKKSLDTSNMPNGLFLIFWPLVWLFIVYFFVLILWTNLSIFSNILIVCLLILAWIFDWLWQKVEAHTLKKVKMSYILPYRNLDKLFIILLWFIFFYWAEWYNSIITFFVAIFTFIITLVFSANLNNFKIDKNILFYIFGKFIISISVIIIGLVLLEYTTLELFSVLILTTFSFHIIANIFYKNDFKVLFTQSKEFYKYRFLWSFLWWTWFFVSFLVIENAWVVLASLISFISIVFMIASMKVILWDTPNKKQIILAFIITLLIWIWYYFK